MSVKLTYPENVIPALRYQFCPMCTTPLVRKVLFDDQISRVTCPECGWIQVSSNVVGAAVVARDKRGIAVILPSGEDGIGLPAGMVEYGEDPAEAAVREVLEETGLEVMIVDCLGWKFFNRASWPGPLVHFFYEAEIVGGEIKGSEEGQAMIVPLNNFPKISSTRTGSQLAMKLYREKIRTNPSKIAGGSFG